MMIFIIGYMAAGKSVFGRQLAIELKYRFLDLDDLIAADCGCSVPDCFIKYGEPFFRKMERRILLDHLHENKTVVATGGGAPCHADNMKRMNESGITVFLDTPLNVIIHRLKADKSSRPLLRDIPGNELPAFIEGHCAERREFYMQAKNVVDPMRDDYLKEILSKLYLILQG
jgi:shikimate kinase